MTPQEAAELVITCTAPGLSGLPLWEYLPGMQVTGIIHGVAVHPIKPTRVDAVYDGKPWAHWTLTDARAGGWGVIDNARPDFTDELTVQALYLLVRRAYHAAGYSLELNRAPAQRRHEQRHQRQALACGRRPRVRRLRPSTGEGPGPIVTARTNA